MQPNFADLSLISSLSNLAEICLTKCVKGSQDVIFDNEPNAARKSELGQCLSGCSYNYIVLQSDFKQKFMMGLERVEKHNEDIWDNFGRKL